MLKLDNWRGFFFSSSYCLSDFPVSIQAVIQTLTDTSQLILLADSSILNALFKMYQPKPGF